ncbi:unnamed protein product, partial [Rotaria socialis]
RDALGIRVDALRGQPAIQDRVIIAYDLVRFRLSIPKPPLMIKS